MGLVISVASPDKLAKSISTYLEALWEHIAVKPELALAIRQALWPELEKSKTDQDAARWVLLPGCCCQAAGGEARWADDVAIAWLVFSLAAHMMDAVEDEDELETPWATSERRITLNVASGLFFTASLALNNLYRQEATRSAAYEIIEDFHKSFLIMCGGQHLDLTRPEPTLAQCWEAAAAKSGAFFALAGRAGARLATADPTRLANFAGFGYHLGLLVQILDDLEEIRELHNPETHRLPKNMRASLPIAYAMEVSSPVTCARLQICLEAAQRDPLAAKEILQIIQENGTGLYLGVEIERHRQLARAALAKDSPPLPAHAELLTFLDQLAPSLL